MFNHLKTDMCKLVLSDTHMAQQTCIRCTRQSTAS